MFVAYVEPLLLSYRYFDVKVTFLLPFESLLRTAVNPGGRHVKCKIFSARYCWPYTCAELLVKNIILNRISEHRTCTVVK